MPLMRLEKENDPFPYLKKKKKNDAVHFKDVVTECWWSAGGHCTYPAVELIEHLSGKTPDTCPCKQESLQIKSGDVGARV